MNSISVSALAVTRVLLGEAPDQLPPMTASEEATETVWLVAKEQSKYWKSVDPRACEPREGKLSLTYSVRLQMKCVSLDTEDINVSIPGSFNFPSVNNLS